MPHALPDSGESGYAHPAYGCRSLALDLSLLALLCLPSWDQLTLIALRRDNWHLFVARRPMSAMLSVFPLGTYILWPAALVLVIRLARCNRRRAAWPAATTEHVGLLLLTVCWLLVPMAIAWMATYWDVARLFFRRYLMVASVAPLMMSALLGSLCPTRAQRATLAVLVVSAGLFTVGPIPQLMHDGPIIDHGQEDCAVRSKP